MAGPFSRSTVSISFIERFKTAIIHSMIMFADDIGLSGKKKSKDEYKSKVKPRTIWDKPDIVDVMDTTLRLKWKASSIPDYAVQTPIWYIVEQRCPPSLEWTRLSTDCTDLSFKVIIAKICRLCFFTVAQIAQVCPANTISMFRAA